MTEHAIAFVGSVLPAGELSQFPAASIAGNRYQEGLMRSLGPGLTAFSMEPHGMWPKPSSGGRVWIAKRILGGVPVSHAETLSYVNVLGLKQLTLAISILTSLARWAHAHRREQRTIIVYNTMSFLAVPSLVVARCTGCKLVLIVADVPIATQQQGILRRTEDRVQLVVIGYADGLIGLSPHTATELGLGLPALVIEGGWDDPNMDVPLTKVPAEHATREPFRVMYSGALNEVSGIELLLEAIPKTTWRPILFDIYGSGPLDGLAAQAASHSAHIRYHGQRPHHEVLAAQAGSNLLVCPRIPDGFVTRYTFPSKIIEYLASGVPVVSNALESLTPEYLNRIIVPSAPEADAWAAVIDWAAKNRHEIGGLGAEGARFVRQDKRWATQGARLRTFLGSLHAQD